MSFSENMFLFALWSAMLLVKLHYMNLLKTSNEDDPFICKRIWGAEFDKNLRLTFIWEGDLEKAGCGREGYFQSHICLLLRPIHLLLPTIFLSIFRKSKYFVFYQFASICYSKSQNANLGWKELKTTFVFSMSC